jgi:hypothetical protein
MKAKIIIAAILIFGYIIFIVPRISTDDGTNKTVDYSATEPATDLEDIPLSSVPLSESQAFNFGGEWRGVLQPTHGAHLDPRDWNLELRFFIKGSSVQVFIHRGDNNWQEVKAGKFRISQDKSNALIYALDSSNGWAESWVFSLSRRDDDSIYVYGNRIINNFKQAPDQQGARITYGATSIFQRSYDRFTEDKQDNTPLTEHEIGRQFKEAMERGKRLSGFKKHGDFTFYRHKLLHDMPDSVILEVDYFYDGLDEDKVSIGAITLTNGKSNGNWAYRPAKLLRGNNRAQIRVSMNDKSPASYCSDAIRLQVYVGGKGTFFEQDVPFEKCWKKQQ